MMQAIDIIVTDKEEEEAGMQIRLTDWQLGNWSARVLRLISVRKKPWSVLK